MTTLSISPIFNSTVGIVGTIIFAIGIIALTVMIIFLLSEHNKVTAISGILGFVCMLVGPILIMIARKEYFKTALIPSNYVIVSKPESRVEPATFKTDADTLYIVKKN